MTYDDANGEISPPSPPSPLPKFPFILSRPISQPQGLISAPRPNPSPKAQSQPYGLITAQVPSLSLQAQILISSLKSQPLGQNPIPNPSVEAKNPDLKPNSESQSSNPSVAKSQLCTNKPIMRRTTLHCNQKIRIRTRAFGALTGF